MDSISSVISFPQPHQNTNNINNAKDHDNQMEINNIHDNNISNVNNNTNVHSTIKDNKEPSNNDDDNDDVSTSFTQNNSPSSSPSLTNNDINNSITTITTTTIAANITPSQQTSLSSPTTTIVATAIHQDNSKPSQQVMFNKVSKKQKLLQRVYDNRKKENENVVPLKESDTSSGTPTNATAKNEALLAPTPTNQPINTFAQQLPHRGDMNSESFKYHNSNNITKTSEQPQQQHPISTNAVVTVALNDANTVDAYTATNSTISTASPLMMQHQQNNKIKTKPNVKQSHVRPRGRAPKGKTWNAETGEWVDKVAGHEYDSDNDVDDGDERNDLEPKRKLSKTKTMPSNIINTKGNQKMNDVSIAQQILQMSQPNSFPMSQQQQQQQGPYQSLVAFPAYDYSQLVQMQYQNDMMNALYQQQQQQLLLNQQQQQIGFYQGQLPGAFPIPTKVMPLWQNLYYGPSINSDRKL